MTSDLVQYYQISPNPDNSDCLVTGVPGPGVVFRNIDTLTGEHVFVGEQAILEAAAAVTGLTVAKLKKAVTAEKRTKELQAEHEVHLAQLAFWKSFAEKMEDAGLVIRGLE